MFLFKLVYTEVKGKKETCLFRLSFVILWCLVFQHIASAFPDNRKEYDKEQILNKISATEEVYENKDLQENLISAVEQILYKYTDLLKFLTSAAEEILHTYTDLQEFLRSATEEIYYENKDLQKNISEAKEILYENKDLQENRSLEEDFLSVKDLTEYLSKYGYLTDIDINDPSIWSADKINSVSKDPHRNIQAALKTLQSFNNIPVTGVLDDTTKALLKAPRCGVRDIFDRQDKISLNLWRKRYSYHGDPWEKKQLRWNLKTDNVLTPEVKESELARALKLWSDNADLEFKEVGIHDDADIELSFQTRDHGDGYSFDGIGNVLAHAFEPGPGLGGDVHFDQEERWFYYDRPPTSYTSIRLYALAAHEIGHALGLGHSNVQGSLMQPRYNESQGCNTSWVLPEDDKEGIQSLYGPPKPKP